MPPLQVLALLTWKRRQQSGWSARRSQRPGDSLRIVNVPCFTDNLIVTSHQTHYPFTQELRETIERKQNPWRERYMTMVRSMFTFAPLSRDPEEPLPRWSRAPHAKSTTNPPTDTSVISLCSCCEKVACAVNTGQTAHAIYPPSQHGRKHHVDQHN